MSTGESHKSSAPKWPSWANALVAPLLVLSVGFHALLLLAPLPSRPVPEVEEETEPEEEEEVVDLLSISSLAEAEPGPPSAAETPAAATPPTVAPPTAPQAPTQPVVPEQYPETPPPETLPPADPPVSDLADTPAETQPVAGFDPNRQAQLVNSAIGALGREPGSSNFDLTDQFPGDIWDLYISQWAAATQQCFFGSIDRNGYTLPPPAADLRYLSRNIQLVERQDIPRTFAGQTVQSLGQAYCGFDLFEVQDGGSPILWVSLVPISPGGSTTLVIFWQADPRG
ncbi:hypothetical protein C7293_17045 [filamentous cyanobacterium CCT1]|nr:hypothetical protein C7293_17045 [filamentous cyanobacterium CCT1]PSN79882.1 hypothetical protein C8B47_09280 [filamentous cyanobacterium CCP4]